MTDGDRQPVPLVLADASMASRAGMRASVEPHGFRVVGEAADAETAVAVALRLEPRLCLLAADLPGGGLEAARAIARRLPDTAIVVLGKSATPDSLVAAVDAGASAYLPRANAALRLADTLNAALDGYASVPLPLLAGVVREGGSSALATALPGIPASRFTQRERQVLEALLGGSSTAEIAIGLGISNVTVRRYVSEIVRKAGVNDRDELIALRRKGAP